MSLRQVNGRFYVQTNYSTNRTRCQQPHILICNYVNHPGVSSVVLPDTQYIDMRIYGYNRGIIQICYLPNDW